MLRLPTRESWAVQANDDNDDDDDASEARSKCIVSFPPPPYRVVCNTKGPVWARQMVSPRCHRPPSLSREKHALDWIQDGRHVDLVCSLIDEGSRQWKVGNRRRGGERREKRIQVDAAVADIT